MKRVSALLSVLFVFAWAQGAAAALIASSIDDFSGLQGQGGWSYGFFNQGTAGNPYGAGAFTPFDVFNGAANRWEAGDTSVGAQNNDFLNLNSDGGHPTGIGPGGQDSIIWAIRRYESAMAGRVEVAFDLRKLNVINSDGGGITGRIFLDGNEILSQLIENTDALGVQDVVLLDVLPGSLIDFAIDPTGVIPLTGSDDVFSARADGSHFSALLRDPVPVPEPAAWPLLFAGLFGLGLALRRPPSRAIT